MKYFRLQENELCTLPNLNNWRDEIDIKNICVEKKHLLPRRKIIDINTDDRTFFAGVMLNPFIMFSEEVFKIVKMYEPSMSGRQIILLDSEENISKLYYIPIIEKVEAIKNSEGVINVNKDDLKHLNIFLDGDIAVPIINLDVAESILKRGVRGIHLEEVKLNIV